MTHPASRCYCLHASKPLAARLVLLCVVAVASVLVGAQSASAITRADVMGRAQVWVEKNVPYSQKAYRTAAGASASSSSGYRTDCSGFTSMCWALTYAGGPPMSLDTLHLAAMCTPITKEELKPGDMMLDAIGDGRHALIFGGWLDIAHTTYIAFEEGGSGSGAARHAITWPHWTNEDYRPYRYKGIRGDWLEFSNQFEPIYGRSRYGTAAAASFRAYPRGGPETVVVCSGESWTDALCASSLAGSVRGPLLLVRPNALPEATRTELGRLTPSRVIVVGNGSAVSTGTADAVRRAAGGAKVSRLGGTDRYATARLVAANVRKRLSTSSSPFDGHVIVATGESFPDALAASPLATAKRWPILLSRVDTLGPDAERAVQELGATHALVIGGPSVVSTGTEQRLGELVGDPARVTRIGERDRYKTATAIAAYATKNGYLSWTGTGVASGVSFPDGLSGGVTQGMSKSVLLLTRGSSLDASTTASLQTNATKIKRAKCFGGIGVVTSGVRATVARILGWK